MGYETLTGGLPESEAPKSGGASEGARGDSDKALLEAAAKAAGAHSVIDGRNGVLVQWSPNLRGYTEWNPLADDGDALRLAVKLKIPIEQGNGWSDAGGWCTVYHIDCGNDPYAATRRAVVRAAAALGSPSEPPAQASG